MACFWISLMARGGGDTSMILRARRLSTGTAFQMIALLRCLLALGRWNDAPDGRQDLIERSKVVSFNSLCFFFFHVEAPR